MNGTFILRASAVHHITMATGVSVGMYDHIMCSHAYMQAIKQGIHEYTNIKLKHLQTYSII